MRESMEFDQYKGTVQRQEIFELTRTFPILPPSSQRKRILRTLRSRNNIFALTNSRKKFKISYSDE